jgi:uncharacterized protein
MKYLLLLAIVLLVIWFVRSGRRGDAPRGNERGGAAAGQPQDMVECPVCQVHLPRADALPGPDGRLYCCAEHRTRAGA